jgi:hypothetical protein
MAQQHVSIVEMTQDSAFQEHFFPRGFRFLPEFWLYNCDLLFIPLKEVEGLV